MITFIYSVCLNHFGVSLLSLTFKFEHHTYCFVCLFVHALHEITKSTTSFKVSRVCFVCVCFLG